MTDKKISQLTGATTPLAGTEVLPVVQGGSTVKVAVSDLTAGRSISASGLTLSPFTAGSVVFSGASGALSQDNANLFWDDSNKRFGVGTTGPDARWSVVTATANSTAARIGGIEYSGNQRGLTVKTYQNLGGDDCGVEFNAAEGLAGYGAFKFTANTTTLVTFDEVGNAKIENGNLQVGTAGKGIDFSATSGTGTSELLDDYEEGEFTATLKGSTTDPTTPVTTSGKYTKIGDQVTIYVSFAGVDTTGAAGNVSVTGLPFTVGGGRSMGNVYVGLMTIANKYITSYLTNSGTAIDFLDVESGGYGGNLQHSAGAGRYLEFSLTYKAA